jgi:hypothetical protein
MRYVSITTIVHIQGKILQGPTANGPHLHNALSVRLGMGRWGRGCMCMQLLFYYCRLSHHLLGVGGSYYVARILQGLEIWFGYLSVARA